MVNVHHFRTWCVSSFSVLFFKHYVATKPVASRRRHHPRRCTRCICCVRVLWPVVRWCREGVLLWVSANTPRSAPRFYRTRLKDALSNLMHVCMRHPPTNCRWCRAQRRGACWGAECGVRVHAPANRHWRPVERGQNGCGGPALIVLRINSTESSLSVALASLSSAHSSLECCVCATVCGLLHQCRRACGLPRHSACTL